MSPSYYDMGLAFHCTFFKIILFEAISSISEGPRLATCLRGFSFYKYDFTKELPTYVISVDL